MKKELDNIVKRKKEDFLPEDAMVTNEHLKQLNLSPKQI